VTQPLLKSEETDALRAQWRAGRFSLSKKLRFCAKLPTNRAFGPVRRARRGVILNEKGVHHPFFKLFPRTFLLLLCFFRQSDALRAIGRAGRFFYSSSNSASS
jgi:hypothetical protein